MTDFIPPVSEMDDTPVSDTPWFTITALITATLFLFSPTSSQGETDPVGLFSPRSHGVIEIPRADR
jgi:hypothetical protein